MRTKGGVGKGILLLRSRFTVEITVYLFFFSISLDDMLRRF